MSMPLTALPPELVSHVVANIESQPTLYNLARCSRQLYLCTIPHLYRHVTICEEVRKEEPQTGKLKNLACLLIRRPNLAGLVRNLTYHTVRSPRMTALSGAWDFFLDSEDSESSGDSESSEEFDVPELSEVSLSLRIAKIDQTFKTAIKTLSLSEEEENNWLRQLSNTYTCNHDLILALLLPALFKLEKLVLNLKDGVDTHYLERMIRRAARRERPFDIQPPLKALKVCHSNAWSTGFLASLVQLPAIQEISGVFGKTRDHDLGANRVRDKSLLELDSFSSPLTSLDLVAKALSTEDLGNVLRAPKALKTFSCKVCPPTGVDFTNIRHALRPQENCLESLCLDYDKEYEYFNLGDRAFFRPMTSFLMFSQLKVFKIAARFLETSDNGTGRDRFMDVLPPSLETFHVTRFQVCLATVLVPVVHLMLQKSPKQIPSLKKLILEETETRFASATKLMDVLWRKTWRGTQETVGGRLCQVAAAQGISIEVIEE